MQMLIMCSLETSVATVEEEVVAVGQEERALEEQELHQRHRLDA